MGSPKRVFFQDVGVLLSYIYGLTTSLTKFNISITVGASTLRTFIYGLTLTNRYKNLKVNLMQPPFCTEFKKFTNKLSQWYTRYLSRFDILHINEISYPYSEVALNLNKPKILTYHNSMIATGDPYLVYQLLSAAQRCNELVVASKFMAREVKEKIGINAKVVYLGVDHKTFKPISITKARRIVGLPLDKKIVFWLQRISPEKDLKTLIDAIPEVAREIPDVLFIIKGRKSGDDKYYNYILQYCRKRLSAYFKNVQLSFKYVNHTKLPYYYNSSDIFVLTSRLEGFGLALVEAMSCGKPVVATNAASVPEIVGDAGILFEPGNSKDLSKKLIELLINEDSKAAYGIKARKRVIENFNWSKSAEQYCNIYSQYL